MLAKPWLTKNPSIYLLLVHFFGQPAPAEGATALCRETGALLIEDAAHPLRPITGMGEYGDCVLYSQHPQRWWCTHLAENARFHERRRRSLMERLRLSD
jgi:dTDP-4-amino-4,6-dideoxygalactose transaminase